MNLKRIFIIHKGEKMLIRIGTNKYHISIGLMYYYNKNNVLNLFEFSTAPTSFIFVICSDNWKPTIWFELRKKMWSITKKGIKKYK